MEATYDPEAEATYIYLNYRPVARTVSVSEFVNIDLADDGSAVGVEVLERSNRG